MLDFRPATDEPYEQAEKWLDDLGVGGFIVFGGDEKAKKKIDSLKRRGRGPAGIGPVIAADLERGLGQQVRGGTVLPPLLALGAAQDEKLAHAAGALTGREARAAGIDWVFAPVLDLADLAENPIVQARALGHDPSLVTRLGLAWDQGLEEEGCIACGKHFPGHGGTAQDSHDALPRVTRSKEVMEARDLVPFRAAAALPIGSFMTAHVAYPALGSDAPATIDAKIITGILRSSAKYDGVVVTDALVMSGITNATGGDEGRAAVLALEAGCDVLLFPKDPRAVVRTVAAWARTGGQEARARLQDAVGRLLHMKRQLGLAGPSHFQRPIRGVRGPASPPQETPITATYLDGTKLARKIADAAITRVGEAKPPLAKGQKVLVLAIDDDDSEHGGLEVVLELQERLGEVR
ncbi:hypothetical protein HY251_15770, partial [bacterium]|nr:hypothetical protein [bacterium]